MRFRSTGLGEAELKGRMSKLFPNEEGLLMLHIQTYDPVQWQLRAGLDYKDIPKIFFSFLRPSLLFHVVRTLIYVKKNPKEPENLMDKTF